MSLSYNASTITTTAVAVISSFQRIDKISFFSRIPSITVRDWSVTTTIITAASIISTTVSPYFIRTGFTAMLSKPDVIGHFDVLNKFSYMPETDDRYIYLAEDAMKAIFPYCKRFEINTGGISRGWRKNPYPSAHLLRLLLQLGGEVVINSDSHHPDHLDFHFTESAALLREIGYESFSVFNGKGFSPIKL